MSRDILEVIEAAYQFDPEEDRWLDGMLDAAGPLLNEMAFAFTYDASDPSSVSVPSMVTRGLPPNALDVLRAHHEQTPAHLNRAVYPRTPFFGTASQLLERQSLRQYAIVGDGLPEPGIADGVAAIGGCEDGRGVMLGYPIFEAPNLDARTVASWSRVAVHLTTAYRLRGSLLAQGALEPIRSAEAILDTDGRVRHAVGPAEAKGSREMLRRHACDIDRARGRLRHDDSEAALELWRALLDARWTLLDHFDSDGRRFFVALENAPNFPVPRALTRRERQVVTYVAAGHSNKLVAYELGISEGTVVSTLSSAMLKLGVGSRAELAQIGWFSDDTD